MVFAATAFVSAFLLFQVQPILGKCILPWFGSSPGVWATCMLFFQVLLLGGYAYAHWLVSWLAPRRQVLLHGALLGGAAVMLPVTPDPAWIPEGGASPIGAILGVLTFSVGLPFVLLAATGPLLQAWFARLRPEGTPYRLYAVSNAGSLLALLTYPFLVEPELRLEQQTSVWSWGYGVFAVGCVACGVMFARRPGRALSSGRDTAPVAGHEALLWLALAACGSGLLLATTNQLCLDVAAVPFLWILPLCLYLLSFIFCFDSERWYVRPVYLALFPLALANTARLIYDGVGAGLIDQIAGHSLCLFVCCMCLHGELARRKPHPSRLTFFFLMVAIGGALGGSFVAIAAPTLFSGFFEYPILLGAAAVLVGWVVIRGRPDAPGGNGLIGVAAVFFACALAWITVEDGKGDLLRGRNFYGVLSLHERDRGDINHTLRLMHGRIRHGLQLQRLKRWPTSYYGPQTGVGRALRLHPRRRDLSRAFRVGVIGLGAGTLAAYANQQVRPTRPEYEYVADRVVRHPDVMRFYELNPMVVDWAQRRFTFLADARSRGAVVEIVVGDARISLQREAEVGVGQAFDVLVVDAFSSDSIPVHLLTREAIDLYWRHLRRDGVLAVHVSNRYLDLKPVVKRLADELGHALVFIDNDDVDERHVDGASWLLMTSNQKFLERRTIGKHVLETPGGPLWTDDFSSLFPLLKKDD